MQKLLQSVRNNGVLLVVIALLLWSGNYVTARLAMDLIPPIALAFIRWVVAGGLALVLAWPDLRRDWPVLRANWGWLLVLGVFGIGIYNTFLYIGLHSTSVMNTALVNASLPLVVAVMTFVFFGERLNARQTFGLVLAMIGVTWVILRGHIEALLDLHFNIGDIWVFAGVTSYAVYTVFLRKVPRVSPMSFLAVIFIIGAVCLFPFYLWEHGSGEVVRWDRYETWIAYVYIIIFPSLAAYVCFNRGVILLGANRASTILLFGPVIGAVLAKFVVGEDLTLAHLIGTILILSGVWIGRKTKA